MTSEINGEFVSIPSTGDDDVTQVINEVATSLGYDPNDFQKCIILEKKPIAKGPEGRTITIPNITKFFKSFTDLDPVALGNRLFLQTADAQSEAGEQEQWTYSHAKKLLEITFSKGIILDRDYRQRLGFIDHTKPANIANGIMKTLVPVNSQTEGQYMVLKSVNKMGFWKLRFTINAIVVDRIEDLIEDVESKLTSFTPVAGGATRKYALLRKRFEVKNTLGSVVMVDSTGFGQADIKYAGEQMVRAVSNEQNSDNLMKVIANGLTNVVKAIDRTAKIFTVQKSLAAGFKYQISHIDATVVIQSLLETNTAAMAFPSIAALYAFVWMKDICRCSANGSMLPLDACVTNFLEVANIDGLGAKTLTDLGVKLQFVTSEHMYDASAGFPLAVNAKTTARDSEVATQYLTRLFATHHRNNSAVIVKGESRLTARTQAVRFIRQLSSITHFPELQEDESAAEEFIYKHLSAEQKAHGVLVGAVDGLINTAAALHITGNHQSGMARLLLNFRGDVAIDTNQKAYRYIASSTRPYVEGAVQSASATVLDWAGSTIGASIRDDASPAYVVWSQNRKSSDYYAGLILKNLSRSATLNRRTRTKILTILSTQAISVPRLVDGDGSKLSYTRASLQGTIDQLKNLQLNSLVKKADAGTIQVATQGDFASSYRVAETKLANESDKVIVVTDITLDNILDAITTVSLKLHATPQQQIDLTRVIALMNAKISIYINGKLEGQAGQYYWLVPKAMPHKADTFKEDQIATEEKLVLLKQFLIRLREAYKKLANMSIEESRIMISVMTNLYLTGPDQEVWEKYSGLDVEYLVRIIYNCEIMKASRVAVLRLDKLGGEQLQASIREAREVREAISNEINQGPNQNVPPGFADFDPNRSVTIRDMTNMMIQLNAMGVNPFQNPRNQQVDNNQGGQN